MLVAEIDALAAADRRPAHQDDRGHVVEAVQRYQRPVSGMSIGDNRLPALADDIRKLHRSIERNAEKIAHDAIEADTTLVKAPRQRRHLSDQS